MPKTQGIRELGFFLKIWRFVRETPDEFGQVWCGPPLHLVSQVAHCYSNRLLHTSDRSEPFIYLRTTYLFETLHRGDLIEHGCSTAASGPMGDTEDSPWLALYG
jgi:hypothetical protein